MSGKPFDAGTWERVRRVRYGAVLKLIRHRYGPVIPDDDSGTPDLWELMQLTSLAQLEPDKKMRHVLETMTTKPDSEVEAYIDHLNRVPMHQRLRTPRTLGSALMMTNAEREALNLRPILPCDLTDEQLKERNRVKKRQREAQRRLRKGGRTREQYLADIRNRPHPWEPLGITQRAWQKRQRKVREVCALGSRGSCPAILTTPDTHPTNKTPPRKGKTPKRRKAPKDKQAERQSHGDRLLKVDNLANHEWDGRWDRRSAVLDNWWGNACLKAEGDTVH